MNGKEIRSAFMEFFRQKEHEIVKSSSLLPRNDPSLLFTNAGMVQFKSLFLGTQARSYPRAASCQKCMRAGGKHSDIENVGFTARHHTFFEMLGNFSFGDYFKKEAIVYAWELLTDWFKIPADRLWVTVYEDDNEAVNLWIENTPIQIDRVVRLGAKDNFWQMGDVGPCGPCSEIIIDQGPGVGCGRPECAVGCDCDRYLELWNLVFMQFNRSSEGVLEPLPSPSIDTGMGLERISAVLQNKHNNFDTDLFRPIIDAITQEGNTHYGKDARVNASVRVIADHMRAITFLLSEELLPANEGRGYVLRRIIRRASRHARLLGVDKSFLHTLIEPVAESLSDIYPELARDRDRSRDILRFEEDRFFRTLEKGTELIEDIVSKLKGSAQSVIPGGEVFRLYDTYGFPLDLTLEIAAEHGMAVDEAGFVKEMEKQKVRGKASWNEDVTDLSAIVSSLYNDAVNIGGETYFAGYEFLETQSTVRLIVKDGDTTHTLTASEEGDIVLDKTTFYGESGGQTGDTGTLSADGLYATVMDTKKTHQGIFIHKVKVTEGTIQVGQQVSSKVSPTKRKSTARNHTATHLLQAALKSVLGDHVKQAGSLVTPDRLRFDFTHFYPLSTEEKDRIESIINTVVMDNTQVNTHVMPLQEALKYGATALFDEKYGGVVRVVEVSGFSKELCGGTHCRATGEIGPFVIVNEGSIASGVRRIEALTGSFAFDYVKAKTMELKAIADVIKADNPLEKVQTLSRRVKELEKELDDLKIKTATGDVSEIVRTARTVNGAKTVVIRRDGLDQKSVRDFADKIRERLNSGIIFVASTSDDQTTFLSMVTKDQSGRFNAGKILQEVAKTAGGRGGGKAEMAQGGTKENDLVEAALSRVYDVIAGA